MREVKKLTLSAILCALAVAIMAPAALVETVDMAMAAVASLTAVFVFLEIGAPYTYLVWIVTSLLMALLFPQSLLWAEYLLIFGLYPFLKGLIERLPRLAWPFVKCVFFNAALLGLVLVLQVFFGMPLLGEGADPGALIDLPFLEGHVSLALLLLWALANITLFTYDVFLTVVVRIYCARFRAKFQRFLK